MKTYMNSFYKKRTIHTPGHLILVWTIFTMLSHFLNLRADTPVEGIEEGKSRIRQLCQLAYEQRLTSPHDGMSHANTALELAEAQDDSLLITLATRMVGVLSDYTDQDSIARVMLQKAYQFYQRRQVTEEQAHTGFELARVYADFQDFAGAVRLMNNNCSIVDTLSDAAFSGDFHNYLGLNLWKLGRFGEAEYQYQIALESYHKVLQPKDFAYTYNNLGVLYFNWNRYNYALDYYQKSLTHFSEAQKDASVALVLGNIGATYYRIGLDSLARAFLGKALEQSRACGSIPSEMNAYDWLGSLELSSENYTLSRQYFEKVKSYYQSLKDYSGVARTEVKLGELHAIHSQFATAGVHFQAALQNAQRVSDDFEITRSSYQIGHNYLFQNDFELAHHHLSKALTLAQSRGFPDFQAQIFRDLSLLATHKNQGTEAYRYLKLARAIGDSISSASLQNKISELEVRYELMSKDKEILILQEEQRIKNLEYEQTMMRNRIYLLSAFLLVLIMAGLILSYRKQQLAAQTIAKLNRELEQALEGRNQLFRILGHDLRGPLGSVRGLLRMLANEEIEERERLTVLESLSQSADSVYVLLDNLLDWARMQTGKVKPAPEVIEMQNLLSDVHHLSASSLNQKNIVLSQQVEPGCQVYGDRQMIFTLFRNLVSNAIKFTPPGGHVSIASATDPVKSMTVIEVKDDGIGIPGEFVQNVFNPSHNKHRRGTGGEPSTGLGLMLVKEYIDQNNGQIMVESRVNEGTVFRVTLPGAPSKR